MLLVTLTIGTTNYYVSTEQVNLTHRWDHYVASFDAPQYDLDYEYGGYCQLKFGTISIMPNFYLDHTISLPLEKQIDILIQHTLTNEAAAIILFKGKAVLSALNQELVSYDLFEDNRNVNILKESVGYDESDEYDPEDSRLELFCACGQIQHQAAQRLPDSDDSNPVYSLANLSGTPAIEITDILPHPTDTTTKCRVTAPSHGYSTGNSVTIETANFSGTYTITVIDTDTFDITQAYYTTRYYMATYRRSGDSNQSSASVFNSVISGSQESICTHSVTGTFLTGTSVDYFTTAGPATAFKIQVKTDNDLNLTISRVSLIATDENYETTSLANLISNSSFENNTIWDFTADGWEYDAANEQAVFTSGGTGSLSQDIDVAAETGYAYLSSQWRVFDDGVAIVGNVITPDDDPDVEANTFWLSAMPVGEVTLSGTSDQDSLIDVFTWACQDDLLALSLNTANARTPSPEVMYWISSQQSALDFLSEIAAFYTHMFYIDWQSGTTDVSVRNDLYEWHASDNGTSEYYLTNISGYDPQKREPAGMTANSLSLTKSTAGSLSAGQWAYGNNEDESLGFQTIYIRLADSADPEGKAEDYIEANFTGTLYLLDMLTDSGTVDITEYDFFNAEYTIPDPIGSFIIKWVERQAVEETSGLFVKDYDKQMQITTDYSFADPQELTAFHTHKSNLKSAINNIVSVLNKYKLSVTLPLDSSYLSSLSFGKEITWTDSTIYNNILASCLIRGLKYDMDEEEVTFHGEGSIST